MDYTLPAQPPPGAPPILNFDQAWHLSRQGWLPLDLPEDLSAEIKAVGVAANAFFDSSHAEKLGLYPPSGGTENGFYHVPEEKEYITFRHEVHADTDLEHNVRKVWQHTANLLHQVLCDLSRAGYFDVSAWDDMIENATTLPKDGQKFEENISLLRLFRYYPTKGFASEHVDVGLLTLCVGDGKGLQVLDRLQRPPKWVDVSGPVILVGDVVRSLFNNRVRAGLHRVVGNPQGRGSFVFALRPCLKGEIDLSLFGGEGVVSTREHFFKIKGSKYNINATKDIRDEQRKSQRERLDRGALEVTPSLAKGQG